MYPETVTLTSFLYTFTVQLFVFPALSLIPIVDVVTWPDDHVFE